MALRVNRTALRTHHAAGAPTFAHLHARVCRVWNEMWMMAYPSSYLPLYNASARALKAVHPSLQVGGPSSEQTQNVRDLITDTKRLVPSSG